MTGITTPLDITLARIQQWIPGSRLVGSGDIVIARVHTDTRTLAPGDLFVALKGERFDANDFLLEAKGQGAVAHQKAAAPEFGAGDLVGGLRRIEGTVGQGDVWCFGSFHLFLHGIQVMNRRRTPSVLRSHCGC